MGSNKTAELRAQYGLGLRSLLAMLTDWQIHRKKKWTTVGEAPVGLLELEDGTILCKSEYRLPSGAAERAGRRHGRRTHQRDARCTGEAD